MKVGERYGEMKTMRSHIEHYLNPLHLYCYLTLVGFRGGRESFAMAVCRLYDHLIYRRLLHQPEGIRALGARAKPWKRHLEQEGAGHETYK